MKRERLYSNRSKGRQLTERDRADIAWGCRGREQAEIETEKAQRNRDRERETR